MSTCIALIRGINVGRAKRVAMADLRELFEALGHGNVRTLLNSGNVIFQARRPHVDELARAIEGRIRDRVGFSAAVVVITAADLEAIIEANPLLGLASDPARLMVAFVSSRDTLTRAKQLLKEPWTPDVLAVGGKAAYLWCPRGTIDSKLVQAFSRLAGEATTIRNWATVLKLQTAAGPNGTAG